MKKIVVLVVAMSLLAGSAMAVTIVGSKHDLSTTGTGTIKATNYTEVCVFCHTPHDANVSVTLAPLWNRTVTAISGGSVYQSGTLTAPALAVVIGDIAATDAGLCLSCHDGSNLTDPLVNPSNLAGAQPVGLVNISNTNAILNNQFNNDHPIAFDYNAAQALDSGLIADPDLASNVTFFGGDMWCSSCHDVHDNANAPFLVESIAGSGLCLECHLK